MQARLLESSVLSEQGRAQEVYNHYVMNKYTVHLIATI